MTSIELGVISVVQRRLERVDVTLNDTLATLDADSLDVIDLVLECEEQFCVKIPEEALRSIETVRDLAEAVLVKM